MASNCEFGQFLNDALRDQFVCGLTGEQYHNRLLSEKDLTFTKACDIALALELAYRDTKELREHTEKPKGAVNKVFNSSSDRRHYKKGQSSRYNQQDNSRGKHRSSDKRQRCYRCGKDNHQPTECYYRAETCHGCGKVGHLKRVCKKIKQSDKAQIVTATGEYGNDDALDLFTVYTAQGKKNGIFVNMELSGKVVHMQVDMGASVSLIPESLYQEQLKNCPLKPAAIHLSSYTEDTIPVLGKILVPVKYGGQEWEQ